MLNLPQPQQGVSLIELLVGLVIIAILLGIGAPALNTWIQNGKIRAAAESIQNGLQLARAEAVRHNSSVRFDLPGTDSTWSVGCVAVDANCPATIQSHSAAEGTTGIEIDTAATVSFNGLGRATSAVTVNVSNSAAGACRADGGVMNCLRIGVTTGGQIRMCDPAYTQAANPRGC